MSPRFSPTVRQLQPLPAMSFGRAPRRSRLRRLVALTLTSFSQVR